MRVRVRVKGDGEGEGTVRARVGVEGEGEGEGEDLEVVHVGGAQSHHPRSVRVLHLGEVGVRWGSGEGQVVMRWW